MARITVDDALKSQLMGQGGLVDLQDCQGKLLGYVVLVHDPALYEGVEIPLSEEELRRRERSPLTYTTREIFDRLQNLK